MRKARERPRVAHEITTGRAGANPESRIPNPEETGPDERATGKFSFAQRRGNFAVFGGTFDPVHTGHLALARAALRRLPLEAVVFVPAARSPFKAKDPVAPGAARLAMLALATARDPSLRVSDVELRPGRRGNYALDTLRILQRELRARRLWWLLGMDHLAEFPRWRAPRAILRLARLGVAARPGVARPPLPRWLAAACDFLPLRASASATALRAALRRAGERDLEYPPAGPLRALPASVRKYLARAPRYRAEKSRR